MEKTEPYIITRHLVVLAMSTNKFLQFVPNNI